MKTSKLKFLFLALFRLLLVIGLFIGWLHYNHAAKRYEALARHLLAAWILTEEPYCVADPSMAGEQATLDEWLIEFERREALRKQGLSVGSYRYRCIEQEAIWRGGRYNHK